MTNLNALDLVCPFENSGSLMQAAIQYLGADVRFFNCDDKHEKSFEKHQKPFGIPGTKWQKPFRANELLRTLYCKNWEWMQGWCHFMKRDILVNFILLFISFVFQIFDFFFEYANFLLVVNIMIVHYFSMLQMNLRSKIFSPCVRDLYIKLSCNPLTTNIQIKTSRTIQKPADWFATQIKRLVFVWWE